MMAMSGVGVVFGVLYLLAVVAFAVLVVWVLVLLIIFLRLRIAQLRGPSRGPVQTQEQIGRASCRERVF